MTTPLVLDVEHRQDGTLAVVARGEIDLSNTHDFARAIAAAVIEGRGHVVTVDLSAVDYLDSGGINVLFTYVEHIRLVVAPLLLPVLTISGLTELAVVEAASGTADG